jgi:hypothetical protein
MHERTRVMSAVIDERPDSSTLIERARAARLRSQELADRSRAAQVEHRRTLGSCLVTLTAVVDRSPRPLAKSEQDLIHLSQLVGRDTAIEDAKRVLAERYGITRAQAFELLRHMSQTGNRKVRDVAHSMLEERSQQLSSARLH